MKKKITIHKKNELLRGSDLYSLNAKRALNAIYYAIQKHNFYKEEFFCFTFVTLRKMMSLDSDNRYVERMKEALFELQQPLELNKFYHPLQKQKFEWYSISFLDEVGFRKENNEWVAIIKTNPTVKHLMQVDGNFTKIDLVKYLNKFKTKYAMKIYEYLKSFNYQYLDITQKHMMKLLCIEDTHTTYKDFAQLKRLVGRQLVEIIAISDLKELKIDDSKELRKNKIFRIYINPKASKKTVDSNKAKAILDALQIKRF